MQVYTGKIKACADIMAEVREIMDYEFAWASIGTEHQQIPMEYPVIIHVDQD